MDTNSKQLEPLELINSNERKFVRLEPFIGPIYGNVITKLECWPQ